MRRRAFDFLYQISSRGGVPCPRLKAVHQNRTTFMLYHSTSVREVVKMPQASMLGDSTAVSSQEDTIEFNLLVVSVASTPLSMGKLRRISPLWLRRRVGEEVPRRVLARLTERNGQ